MNNEPPVDATDPRWLLSAIADGEADGAEFSRGFAAWSGADARSRQGWHAYHLIGDVLRSDDLASTPGHDRVFLQRLNARLDSEPAVLAPAPLPMTPKRQPRWALPAAMAAGVMALATVLVVAVGPSGGGRRRCRLRPLARPRWPRATRRCRTMRRSASLKRCRRAGA
jgi:sigma-E factor negative regulatory protein RseA